MSGPGPWMGPMWGFWWLFPLIGLVLCLLFLAAAVRMFIGGGRFGCTGTRHGEPPEMAELLKEVADLRSQVEKLTAPR